MIDDGFFTKTHCDRCNNPLKGGRRMSRFNTETLCLDCAEKERARSDYRKAVEAERAEIQKGNYNFDGIGLPQEED